jgi:NAD-dependent dihydropyrimidine dehydrogenase PreA subunit
MSCWIAGPCIGTKDTACVEVCPLTAIFRHEELPDKWKDYVEKNTAYYKK